MVRYCKMCGKLLTDIDSRARGYGPECWEKHLREKSKRRLFDETIKGRKEIK